jgi:hypothetical protein
MEHTRVVFMKDRVFNQSDHYVLQVGSKYTQHNTVTMTTDLIYNSGYVCTCIHNNNFLQALLICTIMVYKDIVNNNRECNSLRKVIPYTLVNKRTHL